MAKGATSAPLMDREFQAEDDVRTLMRAEEVKRDRKRMEACRKLTSKRQAMLSRALGRGGKR